MTYPPQQPDHAGSESPLGQADTPDESDSATGAPDTSTTPNAPDAPRRRRAGRVAAILVVLVLVLGGIGAGSYALTRDDRAQATAAEDVRDAYMTAYERKDFRDVIADACEAYKVRFGVDTDALEDSLADYEITATADGDLEIDGDTATGKITLELTSDGTTKRPTILVKIVEEGGQWRFCGEDEG